jgi:hypothetical protein
VPAAASSLPLASKGAFPGENSTADALSTGIAAGTGLWLPWLWFGPLSPPAAGAGAGCPVCTPDTSPDFRCCSFVAAAGGPLPPPPRRVADWAVLCPCPCPCPWVVGALSFDCPRSPPPACVCLSRPSLAGGPPPPPAPPAPAIAILDSYTVDFI